MQLPESLQRCSRLCALLSAMVLLSSPAPAHAINGASLYQQHCAACHDVGTAQAPLLSDAVYWTTLLASAGSTSALTNTVIEGKGAMPAMGGCTQCTEDELRLAVEYMMPGGHNSTITETRIEKTLAAIELPEDFVITLYAAELPGARQMTLGKDGVVYVGSRGQGNVYAIEPNAERKAAAKVHLLLQGLNEPNGVAFHDGSLYIAEIERIQRIQSPGIRILDGTAVEVVRDDFPNRRWHGYKVLEVGGDGWLYTAVGMPCNSCDYRDSQPLFGTIARLPTDGSKLEVFADGVRNSVGMDWHPTSGVLWFTDNGQDLMGDDLPPDELNRAPKAGLDFGFPYVYGDNVPSPGYEDQTLPKGLIPAAYDLQAHVAPLGMAFYSGETFPDRYRNQLLFAQHGSWNRSSKVGYQLGLATIDQGDVTQVEPFARGWLQGQETLGRPVDVLVMPDGAVLVSDDLLGVIYRIEYAPATPKTVSP
ncbi:MAG: PQQ-dependent sugar dehydrogenase [Pseudomonadota bacterium]